MARVGSGKPYKNGHRWWGNFERYRDVGGRREPLVPEGATVATDDWPLAVTLHRKREQHYVELRRRRELGLASPSTVDPARFAVRFLEHLKRQPGLNGRPQHDARDLRRRQQAITLCLSTEALRGLRDLRQITPQRLSSVIRELSEAATPRNGRARHPSTVRAALMELSAMLSRAEFEQLIDRNPVHRHPDLPPARRPTALMPEKFLVRAEVRDLLTCVEPSSRNPYAVEQAYMLYYTGMRRHEVLGLPLSDIDFEGNRIIVRSYEHRGIKTHAGVREVPLWPPLKRVLLQSLKVHPRPANGLAFPRSVHGDDSPTLRRQMMGDIAGSLRTAAKRAGIIKSVNHHIARHSYVSARLQMIARDALGRDTPVSDAVLAREVGHASPTEIQKTYGHIVRERVHETVLDYGEPDVDLVARAAAWRERMGESVRRGRWGPERNGAAG